MRIEKFILSFVLLVAGCGVANAQQGNFYEQIKRYDISGEIFPDKIFAYGEAYFERPEILGYSGDNFQRFYIRFTSVIKNQNSPTEYFVFGNTQIESTVWDFAGTIKIVSAHINQHDDPDFKWIRIVSDITIFEDAKQPSTGSITGQMITDFMMNKSGIILYGAINWDADGFCNNQFQGYWTDYETGQSQKCNWGDFRIPDSEGLDMGAAEFMPDPKYRKFGWEEYQP